MIYPKYKSWVFVSVTHKVHVKISFCSIVCFSTINSHTKSYHITLPKQLACHVQVDFTYAKCVSKHGSLSAWVLIYVISMHWDETIQGVGIKQLWWNIQFHLETTYVTACLQHDPSVHSCTPTVLTSHLESWMHSHYYS